jgi:hypothetical protein
MRRLNTVAAVLVLALLSFSSVTIAQDRDDQRREAQPHMQAALEHLRQAQAELQKAEHDKGGHRAKALDFVNRAMAQVQEGMQYDRTHESRAEEKREHRK